MTVACPMKKHFQLIVYILLIQTERISSGERKNNRILCSYTCFSFLIRVSISVRLFFLLSFFFRSFSLFTAFSLFHFSVFILTRLNFSYGVWNTVGLGIRFYSLNSCIAHSHNAIQSFVYNIAYMLDSWHTIIKITKFYIFLCNAIHSEWYSHSMQRTKAHSVLKEKKILQKGSNRENKETNEPRKKENEWMSDWLADGWLKTTSENEKLMLQVNEIIIIAGSPKISCNFHKNNDVVDDIFHTYFMPYIFICIFISYLVLYLLLIRW